MIGNYTYTVGQKTEPSMSILNLHNFSHMCTVENLQLDDL